MSSGYQVKNSFGVNVLLLSLITLFGAVQSPKLQAQEVEGNNTIEEISESEDTFVGEEVTVRGEVTAVEPGVSFVMQEEGFLEGDRVLVINTSDELLPIPEEDDLSIQVTGEIGTLILADVERDYQLDLDPELYVEYENQPVIFAETMVLSPDIEDVAEEPDSYYLQEIALEGEVDEVMSDYTFTLKEDQLIDDDRLLMINATGEPLPSEDEKIVVTGVVRPYIQAEFERDYDLTWDLGIQEEIEAEYTEKPVFVIDSIYTSAEDDGILE